MASWGAPRATAPVHALVELPGSKSITNRALVLAALSEAPSRIRRPLRARDTELMAAALRGLGARIDDDAEDWIVTPGDFHAAAIDAGLAGTVMRFLPPVAALADGDVRFDGDDYARQRPMAALLDGLRQAGVKVDDEGRPFLPFTVHGRGRARGGRVEIDASSSSQFVSGLLLAGARYDEGVEVVHTGAVNVPSLTHVEMTLAMLRAARVNVDTTGPNSWRVSPGPVAAPDVTVEPDLSNAAPFLAAALATGGSVTVAGWPAATTQAGDALRTLLADMGAAVELTATGLTVTGTGGLHGIRADLHDVGELTPTLSVLAALAESPSTFTGVAHLRGHETDRLAALRTELCRLGGDVDELPDGLTIRPAQLTGGRWHSYADHRMATAGAVLGLVVDGIEIDDIDCVGKTLPDFPARWSALLAS